MDPARKDLLHKLGNHKTAVSLARAVLDSPKATEEQRERARVRLEESTAAMRKIEEELGISRNEA